MSFAFDVDRIRLGKSRTCSHIAAAPAGAPSVMRSSGCWADSVS
jgi:hypothetical protein